MVSAADEAEDRRRGGEGDGQHDVGARGTQRDDDDDVEHQHREGEDGVGEEGEHRIDPAAIEAGEEAGEDADGEGGGSGGGGPDQDGAGAPDHARGHVPAQHVGAEPVMRAADRIDAVGRQEREIVGQRVERSDDRGEDADHQPQNGEQPADQGGRAGQDTADPPHAAAVAALEKSIRGLSQV